MIGTKLINNHQADLLRSCHRLTWTAIEIQIRGGTSSNRKEPQALGISKIAPTTPRPRVARMLAIHHGKRVSLPLKLNNN